MSPAPPGSSGPRSAPSCSTPSHSAPTERSRPAGNCHTPSHASRFEGEGIVRATISSRVDSSANGITFFGSVVILVLDIILIIVVAIRREVDSQHCSDLILTEIYGCRGQDRPFHTWRLPRCGHLGGHVRILDLVEPRGAAVGGALSVSLTDGTILYCTPTL